MIEALFSLDNYLEILMDSTLSMPPSRGSIHQIIKKLSSLKIPPALDFDSRSVYYVQAEKEDVPSQGTHESIIIIWMR